jgi:MFS family permease
MANKVSMKIILSGFPALQHRNYRLFWFGQCISLVGTWMQSIGQSWLVLQLTHSALKLSFVGTIQFLPMMFFSLFAGTLVDRFPKRRILILTQTSLAVLAVVLASLTYFKVVQYWHLLVLALLLGIVNTIDMPTRQSFFVELVGREDLMNAIALNSSIFNLARIIGPAVAGLLIGLVGIAICFYINAVSFLAVIAGLWMIDIPVLVVAKETVGSIKHIFHDIHEGLRYIGKKEIIKQPLLLLAFISTFVMNFGVLIPVFAQQNLGQDATGYGFLMTCMGIGSFVGALILAARSKFGPRLKYLVGGAFGMSLFMVLLGLVKSYQIACITLFVVGLCSIVFTALVNSTIQLNSEDSMRGRVMSVYSLVFGGVTPIGSLFAGNITEYTSAPFCMIISGIIGIVATSYTIFVLRKSRSDVDIPSGEL